MNSLWLGIETSRSRGGAALVNEDRVIAEEHFSVMAVHSRVLLPGIQGLMQRSGVIGGDIAGIAVSAGPGSYTGLRIGIATALGLSHGWNTGVVPVETLRVLSYAAGAGGPVLVCIRARRNEVFAACYSSNDPGSGEIITPGVYTSEAVIEKLRSMGKLRALGNGIREMDLPGTVISLPEDLDEPSPSAAAVLGRIQAAQDGFDKRPVPVYLRGFNERAESSVT